MADDLSHKLLSAVEETMRKAYQDDLNFLAEQKQLNSTNKTNEVHTGLTDSSDDEDNRDFQSAKYNEFGRSIKHLLDTSNSSSSSQASTSWTKKPSTSSSKETNTKQLQLPAPPAKNLSQDVYTDPIFGIRIINPLISSATLKDRMQGRLAVSLMKLRTFVDAIPANTDWVVAGVIVHKTGKTSQKGNPFSIWSLSDLHGDLKVMSLFLFGSAYKELWKCSIGTVVGVLNPTVFEKKKGSKDEACLSVDNVQKVMIFGQSKDFGTCKSVKKDGTSCTSFVNVNKCEFCVYHVRQEYQKCSRRSDLQSSFSGKGLHTLRNKVLGKHEVFYAGKSFTSIPASKSKKLQAKDQGRLSLLSGLNSTSNNISKSKNLMNTGPVKRAGFVQHVEISASRRLKDIELLKKLGGGTKDEDKNVLGVEIASGTENIGKGMVKSAEVTLEESKSTALSVIAKLKAKKVATPNDVEQKNETEAQADVLDENNLSDLDFGMSDEEVDNARTKNGKENQKIQPPSATKASVKSKIDENPSTSYVYVPKKSDTTQTKLNFTPTIGTGFDIPILSGIGNKMIDLSLPITKKYINRANVNALKWVQKNGPIQKQDPNSAKPTPKSGKKRVLETIEKQDPKRQKIQENEHFSQRFKQIMAVSSAHKDLLDQHDNDEAEKYFNKLEMKEKMEEKMTSTFKVKCKAVRCMQCKYTSFSAADRCKEEKHPLKVFDTMKRFFKCGDCGNRSVSLNVVPSQSCKKCGSGKWERAAMMKEKIITPKADLSIRGGEQSFVNSNITNANINLLVPED